MAEHGHAESSLIALVTGANRGLGLETARQLGHLGFTVLLGARDAAKGEAAALALRARYHFDETVDAEGCRIALEAARAGGFQDSFCVVDLLRDREGRWLVLELGTDGIVNLVDRDYANPAFDRALNEALAASFNAWCSAITRPANR